MHEWKQIWTRGCNDDYMRSVLSGTDRVIETLNYSTSGFCILIIMHSLSIEPRCADISVSPLSTYHIDMMLEICAQAISLCCEMRVCVCA